MSIIVHERYGQQTILALKSSLHRQNGFFYNLGMVGWNGTSYSGPDDGRVVVVCKLLLIKGIWNLEIVAENQQLVELGYNVKM